MNFSFFFKLLSFLCIAQLAHAANEIDAGLSLEEKKELREFKYPKINGVLIAKAFLEKYPSSIKVRTQIFAWALSVRGNDSEKEKNMLMSFASEVLEQGIDPNAMPSEYDLEVNYTGEQTSLFELALRWLVPVDIYSPHPYLLFFDKQTDKFIAFVEKLFQQGADPNTMAVLHLTSGDMQIPVLFCALTSSPLVKLFLEYGADINKTDTRGLSALSYLFPKNSVFPRKYKEHFDESQFFETIKILDILNKKEIRLTKKDIYYAKPNLELFRRLDCNSLVTQIEAAQQ